MQEMQETQVWSLGQEIHLEKEMATHFRILVRRIPRTEEPGRLQSRTWLSMHTYTVLFGSIQNKHTSNSYFNYYECIIQSLCMICSLIPRQRTDLCNSYNTHSDGKYFYVKNYCVIDFFRNLRFSLRNICNATEFLTHKAGFKLSIPCTPFHPVNQSPLAYLDWLIWEKENWGPPWFLL